MADCVAAEAAREGAVTGKTLEDQDKVWRRWEQYADPIGLGDNLFFHAFSRPNRIKLMGAFAVWLCVKGDFQSDLMVHWLKAQSKVRYCMWH
jgi:hypothetical protein